jgi:PDZ domain-containing protein
LTDEPQAPPAPLWAQPGTPNPPSNTDPGDPFLASPPPRRRLRWWQWSLVSLLILVLVGVLAGFVVRMPYYTISPGGSLPVESRITVTGARTFPSDGSIRLLYVRERANINFWRYVQAKYDSQIDLFKTKAFTGGKSENFLNTQAVADMAEAQNDAKKVALTTLGYKVPLATQGVVVLAVFPDAPASGVLRERDVILSVDGKPITANADLGAAVRAKKAGSEFSFLVRRNGKDQTIKLRSQRDPDSGQPMIGVFASPQYDYPVNIKIDTSDIGGPSAGLAMTLAIIDQLTPGDLTGGKQVAVTGTIDPQGNVGEIGGIEQKAVAAHAAHAKLFIVPQCTDPNGRAECLADLSRARKRVGNMPVVAVSNLSQALQALEKIGGAPVKTAA